MVANEPLVENNCKAVLISNRKYGASFFSFAAAAGKVNTQAQKLHL